MTTNIGAYATIRWNDPNPSVMENYYFSFEELPDGWDVNDEYVLPLSGKREEDVFYFCTEAELLGMVNPNNHLAEFTVLEITGWERARG